MNPSKTKIMTNCTKKNNRSGRKKPEYVDYYIYLGKQVSLKISQNDEEVDRQINTTWKKFWAQKNILKRNYNISLTKMIIETCLIRVY